MPLADLHPNTRAYLWELAQPSAGRPVALHVLAWNAPQIQQQEARASSPVPTTAAEWEHMLAAVAQHDADAARAEQVHADRMMQWLAPVMVAIAVIGVDIVLPFPLWF